MSLLLQQTASALEVLYSEDWHTKRERDILARAAHLLRNAAKTEQELAQAIADRKTHFKLRTKAYALLHAERGERRDLVKIVEHLLKLVKDGPK
jgi:hypothetical protein